MPRRLGASTSRHSRRVSTQVGGQIEHPFSHVAASAQGRDRRCTLNKRTIGRGERSSAGNRAHRVPRDHGRSVANRSDGL
jgi:hypothetical protein